MNAEKVIITLERIKTWHFFLVAVLFSEVLTLVLNSLQSILRWGVISRELVEIGAIDAIFVSLIVTAIIFPLLKYSTKMKAERTLLQNNIAERRLIEDELRASQQIIEGILNAIPARVFWKDNNLVYLGCNAAFAHDAGFADPREIIGKDDYQMGWQAQADLYRSDDRQVIETGRSKLLVEEPQTTPEGKTITLLTSKIPLYNSQGEISGVLGTYLDITERRKVEEERERLLAELKDALANIKTLKGLLPICSYCKKIRDDKGYWELLDTYVAKHTDTQFSHGLCPECEKKALAECEEFTKKCEQPDDPL
jgi:PAS domain S-box-containing protein